MRIGIDGITISHPQPGGYRTYTTNLVKHLACLDCDHNFVLYLHQPILHDLPSNWFVEVVPAPIRGVGVAYREQVTLPRSAVLSSLSLLHSPCATGPVIASFPRVVTLLDTIEFSTPLSLKHPRLWLMRQYSRLVQSRIAHLARRIITISHYSKAQIIERFGIDECKISVTHLAITDSFNTDRKRETIKRVETQFGAKNYILALASASPRKNIDRLLVSYATLPLSLRSYFPLALICTHPALQNQLGQRVRQLGIKENVLFLKQASDNDLVSFYKAATLFVFPSIQEGFGLPPLEAMACGTPVVASNSSSMPEVLGGAALYVNPTDEQAIAGAITRVLTEPGLSEDLVTKGLVQSQKYSWHKTARETLTVYESAVL